MNEAHVKYDIICIQYYWTLLTQTGRSDRNNKEKNVCENGETQNMDQSNRLDRNTTNEYMY
jgi:hypothetical protein